MTPTLPIDSQYLYSAPIFELAPPLRSRTIDVRVFPAGEGETLRSHGEDLKEDPNFRISEYYRNSTTKLGGLPAIFVAGSYFNTVTPYEEALGYQSSTSRTYQAWALDEDREEFYAVIFHGDQTNFDAYVPIAKKMVDSFQLTENAPIFKRRIENEHTVVCLHS